MCSTTLFVAADRVSETILIAEDDAAVRSLTRRVLERRGYRALEAENGVEALRVWSEHSGTISMLLTDLVMPGGLHGRELAARLHKQSPGLKVLFTSGYSADIAGHELQLQPGQFFVEKPCGSQRLADMVRSCLDS